MLAMLLLLLKVKEAGTVPTLAVLLYEPTTRPKLAYCAAVVLREPQ
jgi:hypothetical protein